MNIGTAGAPEILWSLMAFAGLIAMLSEINDANGDLIILYTLKLNGLRELAAKRAIRRSWVKLCVFSIFLVIGIGAMLTPSPVEDNEPSPLSWLIGVGLITSTLLLVANAWLDRIDRKNIIRAAKRES